MRYRHLDFNGAFLELVLLGTIMFSVVAAVGLFGGVLSLALSYGRVSVCVKFSTMQTYVFHHSNDERENGRCETIHVDFS